MATRRPIWVVLTWVLLAAAAFALAMSPVGGAALFDKLETSEPTVPGSQSEQVSELLTDNSGGAITTLLVEGVDLEDQGSVEEIGEIVAPAREQLAQTPDVAEVLDPFQHPLGPTAPEVAALVSTDRDAFVVRVSLANDLDGSAEESAAATVASDLEKLGADLTDAGLASGTSVTSNELLVDAFNHYMEQDLIKGELVALPISLLVMIIVFGGALAASMPIAGAIASIAAGLGCVWALSFVMDLDSVVINVVTILGLGLSIDYGLLMVSRFREELQILVAENEKAITAGLSLGKRRRGYKRRDPLVRQAVEKTVATAGRTVLFSALTIAFCVAALAAMSPSLLKALGVAGSLVVVMALLSALTLVPALLTLSGRRFLRRSFLSRVPGVRSLIGKLGDVAPDHGVFSRLTTWVQKVPWLVMVGCIALLVAAATPITGMHLRNSGVDMLPEGTSERATYEALNEDFPALSTPDIWVVPDVSAPSAADLAAVSEQLAELPQVESVDAPLGLGDADEHVLLGVRLAEATPDSPEAVEVVHEIREMDADLPLLVGGQAAGQIDFTDSLADGLPLAGGFVVFATFTLLFLMTGSVLIPIKALITNLISISASLGITTWVFQDGHGADLLGFTPVGGLESYIVTIVAAFGFGLAMDYEVFLLSRIKELYDSGMSNNDAVRLGLQRSGRIITSAALVIIVVFAGFASAQLLPIKEVGFALAVAVALDATIVRMLLVPATMTVLGRANWWAPKWMRPIARRFSLEH